MHGYFVQFLVYTAAMTGLFAAGLFVYKKFCLDAGLSDGGKFLKVEYALNINQRKRLLVVKAGNERFLIAADLDRTTLISKLQTPVQTTVSDNSGASSSSVPFVFNTEEENLGEDDDEFLMNNTVISSAMKRINEKIEKMKGRV